MVVKTKKNPKASKLDDVQCNYRFKRKAGRSIIDFRPLFSPDGTNLLVIVENTVRAYNVDTGDIVRVFETESHTNDIVGIEFPSDGHHDLYGCSRQGVLTIWTWENGAVLREIALQLSPKYTNKRVLSFNLINENECFITILDQVLSKIDLASFSTKTGAPIYEYTDTSPIYRGIVSVSIGTWYDDKYVAIANATKSLHIQSIAQPHIKTHVLSNNNFRIISVSAHNNMLAITDTLGRVVVIRGNIYNYREIAREILHWHCLPTLAVNFSTHGSYLYSGGMEKVLVKWTVGNSLSDKNSEKMFIPRLPGIIRYITTNDTHVAITLSNNSVVIANSQLRVTNTILECGGLSPVVQAIGSALVYHKPTGALLMGGRTGHLQLYSTTTDKVLFNIDITRQNAAPALRHNLIPVETEVTCAAVSPNGAWLVTSEYRNDGLTYPDENLKFWTSHTKTSPPFHLNTVVNLSHGGCDVVSIALSYKGEFCVTAGNDQKFRVWKMDDTQKVVSWSCLTAGYYSSGLLHYISHGALNKFKVGPQPKTQFEVFPYMKEIVPNDPVKKIMNIHLERDLFGKHILHKGMVKNDEEMGGVAISQDGSLIAVWFGSKLTLWDTHLCNLRTTLSHPALRPKGVDVEFGNHDCAHYLVCTTEHCVAVWSLLSLSIKWMVQMRPSCLAADPFSNKIAVISRDNDIFVFNPMSSKPILTQKRVLDSRTGVLKQCCFGAGPNTQLYAMRNNSEIYTLEPEQSVEGRLEIITQRNVTSNFGALLAEQIESHVKTRNNTDVKPGVVVYGALEHFLSAAPHMIPPVSLLTTTFLQHLSGHKETETTEPQTEQMDIDPPSSDDEEVTLNTATTPPKPAELWTPNYEIVKENRLKKIMKEHLLDLHLTSDLFGV